MIRWESVQTSQGDIQYGFQWETRTTSANGMYIEYFDEGPFSVPDQTSSPNTGNHSRDTVRSTLLTGIVE